MFAHPGSLRFVAVLALFALACVSACTSNVVLRRPPAYDTGYFGPIKRCAVDAECQDDPSYDSSQLNKAHTRFFQLPSCPYGIHDLAVLDSGSSDAVVLVRCAAPDPARAAEASAAASNEVGLPTATTGGGTR